MDIEPCMRAQDLIASLEKNIFTCIPNQPRFDEASVGTIAQTSIELLSSLKSLPRDHSVATPAFVASLLTLIVSGVDSLKETMIEILATIMSIPPETVNDILSECDPSPPCSPDEDISDLYPLLPTVEPTLAESVASLVDYSGDMFTPEFFSSMMTPFSCLFFMSSALDCLTTLPNDSPLRSPLVSFLSSFGAHERLLKYLGLDSGLWFHSFLSVSFRSVLLNLIPFLPQQFRNSYEQMVNDHYRDLKLEQNVYRECSNLMEVKDRLTDSLYPSPTQINKAQSYLNTRKDLHARQNTFFYFVAQYVQRESPMDIHRIRVNLFHGPIQLPQHLSQEVVFVILRSKSLMDHTLCFSLLSQQNVTSKFTPLDPRLFLELVEKGTYLIRLRPAVDVAKLVLETFLKWVDWDQLELSFMFPHLLPLISVTTKMISRGRRSAASHAPFVEHVVWKGISKLWSTRLSESQRRSFASILVRIGLNMPKLQLIGRFVYLSAVNLAQLKSGREREIQNDLRRVMIAEGCEDLFASNSFRVLNGTRLRAEMNQPD
ncbi:hypothetical protein BLNAU_17542 [Blattamonas nauphoetae]|uniref:Uncharacterized protein n=1 Tax=Blattamonas nauphoetae TaxID=2049346 RepID=A0ABQ9X6X4_9EUKA|nr:hypothetical protein BLNAU_17542 [Blattamonas nauphoetae]